MANIKKAFKRSTFVIVIGLLVIAFWQYTALADWVKLRSYQAPASISHLADADTMTDAARHIFYVNHPVLLNTNGELAKNCPQIEQTIVLGCYHSSESGIYLRTITDSRLSGVEEVTAAHEMLHGAYERLGTKDKDCVDSLLQDYYKNGLHDQRIVDTINSYKKSEPDSVVDEMHSIFGTEVSNLPPQLENYYSRYFVNRTAVANFTNGYEGEFSSRMSKIQVYEDQLKVLKAQIDSQEAGLIAEASKLQTDRESLDSLRSSGKIAQYNATVPGFNQEVDGYNVGVSQLKKNIEDYNTIVELHNQLAEEIHNLYDSLGTSLSTQSAQ